MAAKKNDLQKVMAPIWKTKRFWLNLITLIASSADLYGGYIRELLPGKDGAAVMMLLSFTNMYLITTNAKRLKRVMDSGEITITEKEFP